MAGYFKIWRDLFEKPIWLNSTPEQKVILITLIKMANWKDAKWEWKGKPYHCEPGEFITSYNSIIKDCGKGVTHQNVRTAIKRFENYEFLTYQVTVGEYGGIKVKLTNWDKYQNKTNTSINSSLTDCQHISNSSLTPIKEYKEYKESKEKKNIDIFCNLDFEKCFKIYSENCTNLIPLSFERRAKNILEELREFLVEIDYDFSYFLNLCKKANSLEKIVNSKIDFRSMIRNHIGIINGKYEQQSKGITKETIQAAMQAYKLKKGLKGG